MNTLQNVKFVPITPPVAAVAGGDFTTAYVDTLGYNYATIVCQFGVIGAAGMADLKVMECDTSGGVYADIIGLRGGVDNTIAGVASVLPVNADDNKTWIFQIDLKGRKRFLDLVATAGANDVFMAAIAILSKAEVAPITAAGMNVQEVLRL